MPDDFWSDRFQLCSWWAAVIAHAQGRLADSVFVRQIAYDLYENGAFKDALFC